MLLDFIKCVFSDGSFEYRIFKPYDHIHWINNEQKCFEKRIMPLLYQDESFELKKRQKRQVVLQDHPCYMALVGTLRQS
jgi:hypothetical protein